ncbi:hypothetical protein [Pseudoalteromonas maricaloris]|uniref:hypothetical protein n=1 Tax=Pseudoalteromonas maricaloris TaxID=184924 RepID=UPI0012FD9DC4|nr:hypothetical protein [Pseudoalteromonas flavipulchra]
MSKAYTVHLKDKIVSVKSDELEKLSNYCGFSEDLKLRISKLFLLDLYIYFTEFGINPLEIVEEIDNLENGDENTETKPATEFRRKPLKGLWHKHFFCRHFLAHNILNALGKNGIKDIIKNVMDESGNTHFSESDLSEVARRITNDPITQRANDKKLTGEWIMFAKRNDKNYYLCMNTHEAGDQTIADRISEHCYEEFSFVKKLLETEGA